MRARRPSEAPRPDRRSRSTRCWAARRSPTPVNPATFERATSANSCATLEREQTALGADRPQQPERECTGSDPGLDDRGAREDVGQREDLRRILRVDDRRAAGHRHHEVGEQRPQREVGVAVGGLHDAAVGRRRSARRGTGCRGGCGTPCPASSVMVLRRPFGTGQLHPVTCDERAATACAARSCRGSGAGVAGHPARSATVRPSRLCHSVYAGLAGSGDVQRHRDRRHPGGHAGRDPVLGVLDRDAARRVDPEHLGRQQVALRIGLAGRDLVAADDRVERRRSRARRRRAPPSGRSTS